MFVMVFFNFRSKIIPLRLRFQANADVSIQKRIT